MARRTTAGGVLVALIAVLATFWWSQTNPSFSSSFSSSSHASQRSGPSLVRGKNNTVLFLTTETHGTCNVHIATAFALAQKYPGVSIHYASFPALEKRIARVAALAAASRPDQQNRDASSPPLINFHALAGASYRDVTMHASARDGKSLIHGPGLSGAEGFCTTMTYATDSWPIEDHAAQYHSALAVINEVDPSLVVIDLVLGPANAAVKDSRRRQAVLVPNTLMGHSPTSRQPAHTMLWKYPFMASGLPFPYQSPTQMLYNLAFTYKMIRCVMKLDQRAAERTPALRALGVESVITVLSNVDPSVPYITQTLPGAHVDLFVEPENVIMTGPITLAGVEDTPKTGTVAAANAKRLLDWIAQAPTLVFNLGTMYEFAEPDLRVVAGAVDILLREVPGVQVLWKVKLRKDAVSSPDSLYHGNEEGLLASLSSEGQKDGRVKVKRWLDVEPATIVREKTVAGYVNHGGAGAFHDALGAGVPQIVLPQWADNYDYAMLVEYLKIGLWPCKSTTPEWEIGCLASSFIEMLGNSTSGVEMRTNAARFGEQAKKQVGREVAAGVVAGLAASSL